MSARQSEQPHQIILANESRLLREMLKRVIVKSPHLELVKEVREETDLAALVAQTGAEWVIVSFLANGQISNMAQNLLTAQPGVSILAVASDGSRVKARWRELRHQEVAVEPDGSPVALNWSEPHEKVWRNLSLDQLISILRKDSLWQLPQQNNGGGVPMPVTVSEIAERVRNALEQDPRTQEATIDVAEEGRVVTLTGTVESREIRQAAEEIAARQSEVVEVVNDVSLESDDELAASPPPDVVPPVQRE